MKLSKKIGRLLASTVPMTALACACFAQLPLHSAADGASRASYQWRNVTVVAGGFVDGLIFSPARKNVMFARTDIGGAYKWNQTEDRWMPLNDWAGGKDGNLLGCESIGIDPANAENIYLALGTYTNPGSTNGAIVRTSNGGRTWKRTDMSFRMGGNEDGRSAGERLAVDPNDGNVLYMGSRNDGLWTSSDKAVTWRKVTSFPITGRTNGIGIVFELFNKSTGHTGRATPVIYAAVSQNGPGVYCSTDAGRTWQSVRDQPTDLLPHQGYLAMDGSMYITYGNTPGPNGMSGGAVWKYDTKTGVWTDVSPETGNFGYAGLSVSPKNPDVVMVSTMDRWSKGDTIFRSTDAAKTWTEIGSKSSRDWSLSPYLTFGGSSARFGWWVGALAVDPFDPNHATYGTGATIWSTNDLTNADTGRGTHWSVGARGLEETAVVSLVSPPSGAHLISGLGDIGGFRHDNLNVSPRTGMFTNPVFTTTECIDFAELNPMVVARVGRGNGGANGAYSTDNGITWQPFLSAPSGTPSSGTIAVSSDGKSMVWCPQGATAASSMDNGRTWVACNGLPTGRASVVSDRLRPGTYYVISGQDLYLSADGGTDFSRVSTLPPGTRHLLSVPGIAGDLWLTCGDNGVYHSTDGGVSFAPIGHVYDAERIGFGKAKPGSVYPAIYLTGQTADGASGVFRSDDQGINWIRINDNQHQYGYSGQTVTGDPRVYGRVYMGSNGRGILYGDPVSIAHH